MKLINKILFASIIFSFALPCLAVGEEGNNAAPPASSAENAKKIPKFPGIFIKKPSSNSDNKTKSENNDQNHPAAPPAQSSEKPPVQSEEKKEIKKETPKQNETQKPKQKSKPKVTSKSENSKNNSQNSVTNSEKSSANEQKTNSPENPNGDSEGLNDIISTKEDDNNNKKEYIIRGIISMILVLAGAVLLVAVIITGVSKKANKSSLSDQNEDKYRDKKFQ